MKLSIVIPVYNVAKYVKKCVDSCYNQPVNHDLYEIIIINDGSTDDSLDIIKSEYGNCNNIKIFSQDNKGLSAARNAGLANSCGDYIWFVDSDDWIAPNILEKIFVVLQDNEVIALNYQKVFESSSQIIPVLYNREIHSGRDLLLDYFNTPVQFYIYNRSFLNENKLRFYEGIFHEDSEFTPRALFFASKSEVLPEVAYFYRIRENSIMTTPNPQKGLDYLFVATRLHSFFEGKENDKQLKQKMYDYISMMVCNGMASVIKSGSGFYSDLNYQFSNNRYLINNLKKSSKLKYRLYGNLLKLFPSHAVELFVFLGGLKRKV